MALTDIFKLRPAEPTSASIRQALDRAIAAEKTENAELERLEVERNDQLLDGTQQALGKAESALAEARNSAGRVTTMRQQLEQRLAATIKAEACAQVEAARKAAETTGAAHAAWWAKNKKRLADTLNEGTRLKAAASEAHGDWQRSALWAQQAHPGLAFDVPTPHPDDPGTWLSDLAYRAQLEDFSDLAELPRPVVPAPTMEATEPPPRAQLVPAGHEHRHGFGIDPARIPDRARG